MKRLQFGTAKCVKLHIGKTCNETLCSDLTVGSWKDRVETDDNTGECFQTEYFEGQVKMKVKDEQLYLGDIISSDGKHEKNVHARKNKGLGIINQIMQILQSLYFGKYYFEVAMVLRSSLLLSSLLLNSEAWTNLSESNIRALEQTDEMLLSKILESEANTSNVFKYLELGIYPVRFEIIKRKIIFLQYILQQKESTMVKVVFTATSENPLQNDFVDTCKKYLQTLKIDLTFEEIRQMSVYKFKKLVKQKTSEAAFEYLIKKKNSQSKIKDLEYRHLEIQEYLLEGNENTEVSKLIYKCRGKTLDIKTHKSWKYEDKLCVGCKTNVETENELLACDGFGNEEEDQDTLSYNLVFSELVSDRIRVAKIIKKRIKTRQAILDNG